MSDLANVKLEDFAGFVLHDETMVSCRLTGNADYAAIEALDKLLTGIHKHAIEHRIGEVVMDLRGLEFMNSSCFKCFVRWIGQIQDLEPGRQYKVKLLSEPAMHWQRRSLRTLACFATDLITVA